MKKAKKKNAGSTKTKTVKKVNKNTAIPPAEKKYLSLLNKMADKLKERDRSPDRRYRYYRPYRSPVYRRRNYGGYGRTPTVAQIEKALKTDLAREEKKIEQANKKSWDNNRPWDRLDKVLKKSDDDDDNKKDFVPQFVYNSVSQ